MNAGSSEDFVVAEPGFWGDAGDGGYRSLHCDSGGDGGQGCAVADAVPGRKIIRAGELGVCTCERRDVAAGGDDFAGGEIRVANRETCRGLHARVCQGRVRLINAAVNDGDLDAGTGLAGTSDAIPRLGDILVGESPVHFAAERRGESDAQNTRKAAELHRLFTAGGDIDGIYQRVAGPGDREAQSAEVRLHQGLLRPNLQPKRLGGKTSPFGTAELCRYSGLVEEHGVLELSRVLRKKGQDGQQGQRNYRFHWTK